MTTLYQTLASINEHLTVWFVFPGVILVGLYFTIKLRAIQLTQIGGSLKALISHSRETKGNISPLQAISAVLAGNLGTGNISGVAIALTTGGPGALVWMWCTAFLGAVIQYVTCFLGTRYRRQNELGEFIGGPMHYLAFGVKAPWSGALFSIFTIFGAFTVGNLAQVHSISLPVTAFGLNPLAIGVTMAFCVGLVIFGGIKRFAAVVGTIVPFKAVVYLGCALSIIGLHIEKLPDIFSLIFTSAFSPQAATGGVIGFSVMKAMQTGCERGIFATDAGTGIVPILQASAKTENPVVTGILALLSPVIVMMTCTATALVLLLTGAWQTGLESTNMVTYAFQEGLQHPVGNYIVLLSLLLFSYTTIIAWAFCMDKAVEFLFGRRAIPIVRVLFICIVPVGTLLHVSTVWALADICISCMVLSNLVAALLLRKEVIAETEQYFLTKERDHILSQEHVVET